MRVQPFYGGFREKCDVCGRSMQGGDSTLQLSDKDADINMCADCALSLHRAIGDKYSLSRENETKVDVLVETILIQKTTRSDASAPVVRAFKITDDSGKEALKESPYLVLISEFIGKAADVVWGELRSSQPTLENKKERMN